MRPVRYLWAPKSVPVLETAHSAVAEPPVWACSSVPVCETVFLGGDCWSKTLCEKVRVWMVAWGERPCGQGEAFSGECANPRLHP